MIWEYKIERIVNIEPKLLRTLGQNGWELVTVVKDGGFFDLIFKRPTEV